MTVPQRLHFSAQLSDCNLATCWHIDLSILGLFTKMTLGLALGEFCTTTEKHWCPVSIFAYFRGNAFLGKPAYIRLIKHGCNSGHHDCSTKAAFLCTAVKLQSCHILAHWTQHTWPSPSLEHRELLPWERTPWPWSKHVKFRPSWIMTVPQRLCFSAQLSNCNVATCCLIELSILGLLHLSIRIRTKITFSCCMKFFQLKMTLGLALGWFKTRM